jgi:hypothetical protein
MIIDYRQQHPDSTITMLFAVVRVLVFDTAYLRSPVSSGYRTKSRRRRRRKGTTTTTFQQYLTALFEDAMYETLK